MEILGYIIWWLVIGFVVSVLIGQAIKKMGGGE